MLVVSITSFNLLDDQFVNHLCLSLCLSLKASANVEHSSWFSKLFYRFLSFKPLSQISIAYFLKVNIPFIITYIYTTHFIRTFTTLLQILAKYKFYAKLYDYHKIPFLNNFISLSNLQKPQNLVASIIFIENTMKH